MFYGDSTASTQVWKTQEPSSRVVGRAPGGHGAAVLTPCRHPSLPGSVRIFMRLILAARQPFRCPLSLFRLYLSSTDHGGTVWANFQFQPAVLFYLLFFILGLAPVASVHLACFSSHVWRWLLTFLGASTPKCQDSTRNSCFSLSIKESIDDAFFFRPKISDVFLLTSI